MYYRLKRIQLMYPHTGKICEAHFKPQKYKKLRYPTGQQAYERMSLVEKMGPNLVSPAARCDGTNTELRLSQDREP